MQLMSATKHMAKMTMPPALAPATIGTRGKEGIAVVPTDELVATHTEIKQS